MDQEALWFGIVGLIAAVLVISVIIKCVKDDNDD
jgi:hypothetical protein